MFNVTIDLNLENEKIKKQIKEKFIENNIEKFLKEYNIIEKFYKKSEFEEFYYEDNNEISENQEKESIYRDFFYLEKEEIKKAVCYFCLYVMKKEEFLILKKTFSDKKSSSSIFYSKEIYLLIPEPKEPKEHELKLIIICKLCKNYLENY